MSNGLQDIDLPNTAGEGGDTPYQYGKKINQNNRLILTVNDSLVAPESGLTFDRERRELAIDLAADPESGDQRLLVGSEGGINQRTVDDVLSSNELFTKTVQFAGDLSALRTDSTLQAFEAVLVKDTVNTASGNQASIYRWDGSSLATEDEYWVIRPDAISSSDPGRWHKMATIPLELSHIILYAATEDMLASLYPAGSLGDGYVAFCLGQTAGDGNPGYYVWDSTATDDPASDGIVKPDSLGGGESGRWIRQTGGNFDPLEADENLADLTDVAAAVENLGLTYIKNTWGAPVKPSDFLSNNDSNPLGELADGADPESVQSKARDNLGLGTASVKDQGNFLQTANQLGELSGATAAENARANIGVTKALNQLEDALKEDIGNIVADGFSQFYGTAPSGQRIYVSQATGNDENYGFTPDESVKTIREAALIAFAMQAPDTLAGNKRRDALRALMRNRSIIVEEILGRAEAITGSFRVVCKETARSAQDIGLIYDAVARDLLLEGNRETVRAFNKLFDAFNTLDDAVSNRQRRVSVFETWDGSDGTGGLMDTLQELAGKAIEGTLSPGDFSYTSVTKDEIYKDHVTVNDPTADPNPCGFIRDDLDVLRNDLNASHDETNGNIYKDSALPPAPLRPDGGWLNLTEDRSPNQANRLPYSTILVESGTYPESFPIYLPDRVTVSGDSLRRVTIVPQEAVKQRGAGLHQRILPPTFRGLVFDSGDPAKNWYHELYVTADPSSNLSNLTDTDRLVGGRVKQSNVLPGRTAEGEIQQAERLGSKTYPPSNSSSIQFRLRIVAEADVPFFTNELATDSSQWLTVEDNAGTAVESQGYLDYPELFRGYLLLKGTGNAPVQVDGNATPITSYSRGDTMNPVVTLDRTPAHPLRKGDVVLALDTANQRRELLRVDTQSGTQVRFLPHRFNGPVDLQACHLYLAPRTYWQTQCEKRSPERGFSEDANSRPSFETQTDPAEVGEHAFLVGNANYIFQVNFKEHTNFAFAFRKDVPQVYASPYIQNCSSLTTKGGAGILVDGEKPKQPDVDYPLALEESNWPDNGLGSDIYGVNIDAANLLSTQAQQIVDETVAQLPSWIGDTEAKCRRDMHFIIEAIAWQLVRGGNDRVYDYGVIIASAIQRQAANDDSVNEATLQARYAEVLGQPDDSPAGVLRGEMKKAINGTAPYSAGSVTSGDCSDVESAIESLCDILNEIVANGNPDAVTRTSHLGEPWYVLNRTQDAELRSFVLDAFTQINTFGGFGHLVRRNGYAQLVSTFTTFCDIGVKVESGGLVNLSNSVSDFGWHGLVADGLSQYPYLEAEVAEEVVGVNTSREPQRAIYLRADSFQYRRFNDVFAERDGTFQNLGSDEERAREAVEAIQFNSTLYFFPGNSGEGYDFESDGNHLPLNAQVPRVVEVADNAASQKVNQPSYRTVVDDSGNEVTTVRVLVPANQRIPGKDVTNLDTAPRLEQGAKVRFYITSTITSSGHGFEYVGSGDDYSNALPENGGVPDPDMKTLATDGGQVFVSSTDVQGNFSVGPFFSVEQSTGAITFNPESLQLSNLTRIGPFKTRGVVGNEYIEDLTNNQDRLLQDDIRGPAPDDRTITTVEAIRQGIDKRTRRLQDQVELTLAQATQNNKILEALRDPINDLGAWATRHFVYHRDLNFQSQDSFPLPSVNLNNDETLGFVSEFGGALIGSPVELSEFRTRSSYTANLVVDTSESMSKSGEFAQIKQDLINFAYNFDARDSLSLYLSGDSTANWRYAYLDSNTDPSELESGGSLAVGTQVTLSYPNSIETVPNTSHPNVGESPKGTVRDTIPSELKIALELTDSNGLLSGVLTQGTALEVNGKSFTVVTVEPGIAPKIFSITDSPTIVGDNPGFNFAVPLRNGLIREIGAVMPDSQSVFHRNLLEARTDWLRNGNQSLDWSFYIYPDSWNHGSWGSNAADFVPNEAEITWTDSSNKPDPTTVDFDFHTDDTTLKYLPPRTTLTTYAAEGVGADYLSKAEDLFAYSAYDPNTAPDGYLSYDDFANYTFLDEITSNPQLDVCFVFLWADHPALRRRDHIIAENFRNLFSKLNQDGILDWRVGKLVYRNNFQSYLVKDIDADSEASYATVSDSQSIYHDYDRRLYANDNHAYYRKTKSSFAVDNGGSLGAIARDTANLAKDGSGFWLHPKGDFHSPPKPVFSPFRVGTTLRLAQKYQGDTNPNFIFPLNTNVTTVPWQNNGACPHAFKAGDRIRYRIVGGSFQDGSFINFVRDFIVAQDTSAGATSIPVESQDLQAAIVQYCQNNGETLRSGIDAFSEGATGTGIAEGGWIAHNDPHPIYAGKTINKIDSQGNAGSRYFRCRIEHVESADMTMDLEVAQDFIPTEDLDEERNGGFINVKPLNGGSAQWDSAVSGEVKTFTSQYPGWTYIQFSPDQTVLFPGHWKELPTYHAIATACREMKWRPGSTRAVIAVDPYARRQCYSYGSLNYGRRLAANQVYGNSERDRHRMRRHDELILYYYRTRFAVERGENRGVLQSRFPYEELAILYQLALEGKRFDQQTAAGNQLATDSLTYLYIDGLDLDNAGNGNSPSNNGYSEPARVEGDISFLAEELLRHKVNQFHMINKHWSYFRSSNHGFEDFGTKWFPDPVDDTIRPFHRHLSLVSNFNDPHVRRLLRARAFDSVDFRSGWDAEKIFHNAGSDLYLTSDAVVALPQGRFLNWDDLWHKRNLTQISDLVTSFYNVIGEGKGALYSDARTSDNTAQPPIYQDRIQVGDDPANFAQIQDNIAKKWPTPAVLPSPSIGPSGVLSNSPDANNFSPVPGITLGGRSALYESIIAAQKDLTPERSLRQLNLDRRSTTRFFGRNPARQGTINATAVISDGIDNDSFSDQVISYNYVDGDSPNSQLKRLFEALFVVPGTGRVHTQVGSDGEVALVQQRHIYTAEVLNLLRSVAFAQSDAASNNNVLDLAQARLNTYNIQESGKDAGIVPFGGDANEFQRAKDILAVADPQIVDDMGLIVPVYEGSGDATDLKVRADAVRKVDSYRTLVSESYFPNPYRFMPFSFPVNTTPGNQSLGEALIYTYLAEEGPDLTTQINLEQLSLEEYDFGNAPPPSLVTVRLYSKLGFLHANLAETGGNTITTRLAVLDPGFGQSLSLSNRVLAQNLDERGNGTIFRNPSSVVKDAQTSKIVQRDGNGVPLYRNNPGRPLFEQRRDYLASFTESARQNHIVQGVPLVSRRYVGDEVGGEYLGAPSIASKDNTDHLFLSRVDSNGNERNAIYSTSLINDDTSTWEWFREVGVSLKSGGTNLQASKTPNARAENLYSSGQESALVVLKDKVADNSKVMALAANGEEWQAIADDNSNGIELSATTGDYFQQIFELTGVGANGDNVLFLLKRDELSNRSAIYFRRSDFSDSGWTLFGRGYTVLENARPLRGNEQIFPDYERFSVEKAFGSSNNAGVYYWDPNYDLGGAIKGSSRLDEVRADLNTRRVIPIDEPVEVESVLDFGTVDTQFNPNQSTARFDAEETGERVYYIYSIGNDIGSLNGIWRHPNPIDGDSRTWGPYTQGDYQSGSWVRDTSFDNVSNPTLAGSSLAKPYQDLRQDPTQSMLAMATWQYNGNRHLAVLVDSPASELTEVAVRRLDSAYDFYAQDGTTKQPAWNRIGLRHPKTASGGTLDSNDGFQTFIAEASGDTVDKIDNNCRAVGMISADSEQEIIVAFGDDSYAFSSGGINGNKLLAYRDTGSGFSWVDITPSGYSPGDSTSDHGYIDQLFNIDSDGSHSDGTNYDYRYSFSTVKQSGGIFLFLYDALNGVWQQVDLNAAIGASASDFPAGDYEATPVVAFKGAFIVGIRSFRNPEANNVWKLAIKADLSSFASGETAEVTNGLKFRPLVDPSVYPRFPHGDNWIRDALIGLNRGEINAVESVESRNFSWNAPRYERNNLFSNIEAATKPYRDSLI